MVVPPLFQRVPQRGKGPGLRSLLARYRPRLSIISRKTFWKTQARRYHSTGGRPRTGSDFTIDDRKTVGAPRFISVVTIEGRKIVQWRDYMDSLAAIFGFAPAEVVEGMTKYGLGDRL